MTYQEIFVKIRKRLTRKDCLSYFKKHYTDFNPWLKQQAEIALRDLLVKTDGANLAFKDGKRISLPLYSALFRDSNNPSLFFKKIIPGTAPKLTVEEIESIAIDKNKEIEWLGYQNLHEWFLGLVRIRKIGSKNVIKESKSEATNLEQERIELIRMEEERKESRKIQKELKGKTNLEIRFIKLERLIRGNSQLSIIFKRYNKNIFCFYSHSFFDAFWRLESHLKGRNLKAIFERYPRQKEVFCWKCKRRGRCLIWIVPSRDRERIRDIAELLKIITIYDLRNLKNKQKLRKNELPY